MVSLEQQMRLGRDRREVRNLEDRSAVGGVETQKLYSTIDEMVQ